MISGPKLYIIIYPAERYLIQYQIRGIRMGFLDKLTSKTANKAADRVSDKIVDGIFGKKKKKEDEEVVVEQVAEPMQGAPTEERRELTPEEQAAIANAQAMSAQSAQEAMGIAYNTKRCPECQAICLNAPVTCPYCGADLKGVKPLTPKELEELEG